MANNETCIHNGVSPVSLLQSLPRSQAGSGRHRCPTCAYEQGFILGSSSKGLSYNAFCQTLVGGESCKHGSTAPSNILLSLGENQGGTGRHKCTNCAFKEGFNVGLLDGSSVSFNLNLVEAPKKLISNSAKSRSGRKIDFLEEELKNKQLGYLGELLVLKNEIEYLTNNGYQDLAKKVKHVSVDEGDGVGYDILSFDIDGNHKMIEVKTTRADILRPFYLTRNELNTSLENPDTYFLYRVFDFDTKLNRASFYIVEGNLQNKLNLEPLLFSAFPKK